MPEPSPGTCTDITDPDHTADEDSFRVFLLYSTKAEAIDIFRKATKMGLTGKSFMWIVTQAVIGSELDAPQEFPVGMLGVHFDTSTEAMIEQVCLTDPLLKKLDPMPG